MPYKDPDLPQGETELEAMAEAELSRLKRQYRIMENDRVAYAEDARLQLCNQLNMIERFECERAELVMAIKKAKSPLNLKKDEMLEMKLKCLLDKRSEFIEIIKNEKQQIAEVQEQILKMSKEVDMLKTKMPSEIQEREAEKKQSKQIAILEDRLEVATKKFNMVVAENARLRDEIDGQLKERALFNSLWSKLVAQLDNGKQVIGDLIDQATIAFNQREEELNKILALKERAARDLKNHMLEMCELQRTLDNEMKLQEFLGIKGQYREMADLNAKKEIERQAKREELQNKVETYTKILNRVKEFTGEEEIDHLITNFVKQEEENFALFNYVNELNDEVEGLQARLSQLRADIEEARALNTHRGQKQAETIDELANQLDNQTNLANQAEQNFAESRDTIDKLLTGIDTLFRTIDCDNSPILLLLGDNTQVTMNNVMLYLGLIEKRITELFNKVHWIDKTNKTEPRLDEDLKPKLKVPDLSSIAPTQPCPLCVEKEFLTKTAEEMNAPITLNEAQIIIQRIPRIDMMELMHNVSGCNLPAARKIVHKRYQP